MALLTCPSSFAHSRIFFPRQRPIFITESAVARFNISKMSFSVKCCEDSVGITKRTCKNCKGSYEPNLNNVLACRFHTAHFGGETRRKFESVYTGGTMDTPESGKVLQYWHCCGSEDPFDPGCTSGPHLSYDD